MEELMDSGKEKGFALYDEIKVWIEEMANTYPDLASTGSIGKTSEGRDMRYIRLGAASDKAKKIIFIEAGLHARFGVENQ